MHWEQRPEPRPDIRCLGSALRGWTRGGYHWLPGNMIASSYPGDTVTLRYVEEYEYYFWDTGELIPVLDETVTNGNLDRIRVRCHQLFLQPE